jgi:phosphate transport system substrate-binding protein
MRTVNFRLLLCLVTIGLFFTLSVKEASAAALQIELCSIKTGKHKKVTVLESNSEFLDVLDEDGERMSLPATGYQQCPGPPPPIEVVEPPIAPSQKTLDTLRIAGSSTVGLGVLPYFIQGYAKTVGAQVTEPPTDDPLRRTYELAKGPQNAPFLRIIVKSYGSNTSLPDMIDKQAEIGVSSRPFTEQEIAKLLDIRGVGSRADVEHVIALDGVQFFVNKENPATVLKLCDVARLFAGKITNWKQLVSGASALVDPHTGDNRSGTFEIVTEILLNNCAEKMSPSVTPHNSQKEIISFVGESRGGVGYSAKALSQPSVKTLRLQDDCGIEIDPTPFNIKAEDYPLSRRLYLFTPRSLPANSQAFLDYVLSSDAAQSALNESEATDQSIEVEKEDQRLARERALPENQDPMARKFGSDTAEARRLSISYRFASNDQTLDTKAIQDILRLVAYLHSVRERGSILLTGFADSSGDRDKNQALSQGRAETVRSAIAKLDPTLANSIVTHGYGSVLPVACNDTELGKAKNRRVEVWVKGS